MVQDLLDFFVVPLHNTVQLSKAAVSIELDYDSPTYPTSHFIFFSLVQFSLIFTADYKIQQPQIELKS